MDFTQSVHKSALIWDFASVDYYIWCFCVHIATNRGWQLWLCNKGLHSSDVRWEGPREARACSDFTIYNLLPWEKYVCGKNSLFIISASCSHILISSLTIKYNEVKVIHQKNDILMPNFQYAEGLTLIYFSQINKRSAFAAYLHTPVHLNSPMFQSVESFEHSAIIRQCQLLTFDALGVCQLLTTSRCLWKVWRNAPKGTSSDATFAKTGHMTICKLSKKTQHLNRSPSTNFIALSFICMYACCIQVFFFMIRYKFPLLRLDHGSILCVLITS